MNMLDKLFSKEIQRRTGAHAISIYIDSNQKTRKRSRSIGSRALKNATKITTKQDPGSLFHRLNIRLPWLKFVTVLVVGLIIILDLTGATISRLDVPSNQIKIAPMSHHVRVTERNPYGKKLVALTFDDGPSPTTTPVLLDVLTEKDVPATFFMLGTMARNHPEIVRRAARERHEIASHTMYHQNLIRITPEAAQADLNEAKATFKEILGYGPTCVRPPYGNFNDFITTAATRPLILWSVDTLDWQSKDPNAIIATAVNQIHDGAIVLMHDIYPTTVEAVPTLVDTLRSAGYEFVTISEMAKLRDVQLSAGTAYYNFRP